MIRWRHLQHMPWNQSPNGFGHCTRWHQIAEFDKLVNQLNRYFGTEGDLPKWLSATAQACSTLPYLESALERSINQLKYGIARGAWRTMDILNSRLPFNTSLTRLAVPSSGTRSVRVRPC